MALEVSVYRAFSGEVLCNVDLNHDSTVHQLKELIQKSSGIPVHNQRLLTMDGSVELCKKGEEVMEALEGRPLQVSLIVRQYQRREMQAAWIIEGIWKRRRGAWRRRNHNEEEEDDVEQERGLVERVRDQMQHEAAAHIAAFWRRRTRSNVMGTAVSTSERQPTSGSFQNGKEDGLLERVMQESAVEAVLREQEHLSRAMLLSKQDQFSGDEIAIFRLTKHSPKVFEVLLESPELSFCHERAAETGCGLRHPWSRGFFLIPLTEGQYKELGLELEPHHVLARACDREPLEKALRQVPCRLRPQVRTDHRATMSNRNVSASGDQVVCASVAAPTDLHADHGPFLQVVRTFLHSPVTPLVTEASSSQLAHSAPADVHEIEQQRHSRKTGANASHTMNPRRWK